MAWWRIIGIKCVCVCDNGFVSVFFSYFRRNMHMCVSGLYRVSTVEQCELVMWCVDESRSLFFFVSLSLTRCRHRCLAVHNGAFVHLPVNHCRLLIDRWGNHLWSCLQLLLLTGHDHCRLLLLHGHLLRDTAAHCTTTAIFTAAHEVLVWLRRHHLWLTGLLALSSHTLDCVECFGRRVFILVDGDGDKNQDDHAQHNHVLHVLEPKLILQLCRLCLKLRGTLMQRICPVVHHRDLGVTLEHGLDVIAHDVDDLVHLSLCSLHLSTRAWCTTSSGR